CDRGNRAGEIDAACDAGARRETARRGGEGRRRAEVDDRRAAVLAGDVERGADQLAADGVEVRNVELRDLAQRVDVAAIDDGDVVAGRAGLVGRQRDEVVG